MEEMVTDALYGGFYKGKRVFVTGHTGFKGAWTCLLLRQLGATVHGYSLRPPTVPSLYEEAHVSEDVSTTIGDVRDLTLLTATMRDASPDIVLHMAAQPLVRESYRSPVDTYATNVMGTVHLLEAVRSSPSVRAVINVTTDKCYENREWCWGYRELDAVGGYDPYSNSKACSELVTSAYRSSYFNASRHAEHRVAVASARAGNVIGGGDWAPDRLIPDVLRAFAAREKVTIRNPQAIRPWQDVLEPINGYLTLGHKLCTDGMSYADSWNFGPEDHDARTVAWVVAALCELWGEGASYKVDTTRQPHETGHLRLDCSKARARLGWRPKWNIDRTLCGIATWNKARARGRDVRAISLEHIAEFFDG